MPKQDRIVAPKSTAQTIIARIPTGLTNTAPKSIVQKTMARTCAGLTNTDPKSTILKNIDRVTWVGETASLHLGKETE